MWWSPNAEDEEPHYKTTACYDNSHILQSQQKGQSLDVCAERIAPEVKNQVLWLKTGEMPGGKVNFGWICLFLSLLAYFSRQYCSCG